MTHPQSPVPNARPPTAAQVRMEIAAARFRLALLRHIGELKYREDQSRLPKGPGGGQFANEGRGTSRHGGAAAARVVAPAASRVVAGQAGHAAAGAAGATAEGMGATGAVAGAVAGAAPVAVGGMGISRAAGLAEHYMTGVPVTPFLHLPVRGETTLGSGGRASAAYSRMLSECNTEFEDDMDRCKDKLSELGLRGKARADAKRVCEENAAERLRQCIKSRNTRATAIPLFRGMPEKKK